jgi:hypothetical protein
MNPMLRAGPFSITHKKSIMRLGRAQMVLAYLFIETVICWRPRCLFTRPQDPGVYRLDRVMKILIQVSAERPLSNVSPVTAAAQIRFPGDMVNTAIHRSRNSQSGVKTAMARENSTFRSAGRHCQFRAKRTVRLLIPKNSLTGWRTTFACIATSPERPQYHSRVEIILISGLELR